MLQLTSSAEPVAGPANYQEHDTDGSSDDADEWARDRSNPVVERLCGESGDIHVLDVVSNGPESDDDETELTRPPTGARDTLESHRWSPSHSVLRTRCRTVQGCHHCCPERLQEDPGPLEYQGW